MQATKETEEMVDISKQTPACGDGGAAVEAMMEAHSCAIKIFKRIWKAVVAQEDDDLVTDVAIDLRAGVPLHDGEPAFYYAARLLIDQAVIHKNKIMNIIEEE
jgi:hypothetical protein